MSEERPLCRCHGEAMLWNRNPGYRAGGYWACRAKRRARNAARTQAQLDQSNALQRARYEADPIFRIELQLRNAARKRRATVERMRQRLQEGE